MNFAESELRGARPAGRAGLCLLVGGLMRGGCRSSGQTTQGNCGGTGTAISVNVLVPQRYG
jgi:hypothetical protein